MLAGSAARNSGIKRVVLAWVGVSGAEGDYRCRHFDATEDIGAAPNMATGRNRCKEYEPIEARRQFRNAFDREKQTEREARNDHAHIGVFHRLG